MYPRTAKSIPISRAGAGPPRPARRCRVADPGRADEGDPRGPGRPAVERRHRHLRQGPHRDARRRRRQGQRRRSASTAPTCGSRSSARAATSGSPSCGRIEFALAGGRINTDAIDNSAGVDTSDHEVNIKILLDQAVRDAGDSPAEHRNPLLAAMTDEVARAGAARQLRAERPARQRPGAGAGDALRARPADQRAGVPGRAGPGAGVPPVPGRDRAAGGRRRRPHVVGARGAGGVLQDQPHRDGARVRRAGRRVVHRGAAPLLPAPPRRAARRPAGQPPAAPRDRDHLGRPTTWSTAAA